MNRIRSFHITFFLIFLCLLPRNLNAQEIPKDTILLDFTQYKEKCEHTDLLPRLKIIRNEGIQFNLCGKAVFLHPTSVQADTIRTVDMKRYTIETVENIEIRVRKWREKVRPLLQKKYGELFPQTVNKNNMFETYLIEQLTDTQIALYRVYWLNQEIQR